MDGHFKILISLLMMIVLSSCLEKGENIESKKLTCQIEWGSGAVQLENGCSFESSEDGNPSQVSIKTAKWQPSEMNFTLKLRVRGAEFLEGIRFIFSDGKVDSFSYEVPMFADPEFNILQEDTFVELSIPKASLKIETASAKPIQSVKVYIKAKDKGQVKVQFSEYKLTQKEEKKGIVSITFDDGYKSNLLAVDIMKNFGLKGTAYLIPDAFDKPGYLSQEDVKNMKKSGWDISSHYNDPVTTYYPDELVKHMTTVKDQLSALSENAMEAQHFAYPLGKHKQKVIDAIKTVFKSARLASGGFETLPPGDVYRIRSINVLPNMSAEALYDLAKKAYDNGDWAVFMFHSIDEPTRGDLDYSSPNFKLFIEKLNANKITVKTVNEVL